MKPWKIKLAEWFCVVSYTGALAVLLAYNLELGWMLWCFLFGGGLYILLYPVITIIYLTATEKKLGLSLWLILLGVFWCILLCIAYLLFIIPRLD